MTAKKGKTEIKVELTLEQLKDLVRDTVQEALANGGVITAVDYTKMPLAIDPYERRIAPDTTGAKLRLHPDGQIEVQRKGSNLWEIMYNHDGVSNILSVANLVRWPFVNKSGQPCNARGEVMPDD